uniref:Uncharacterized protein n=1 Tax=Solanum tuberosum TaxID=4113 RepID=M1A6L6_SOLTU
MPRLFPRPMTSVHSTQKHAVLPVLAVGTPMKAVSICYHLSYICIVMEPFYYTKLQPKQPILLQEASLHATFCGEGNGNHGAVNYFLRSYFSQLCG